jgi:ferritin
LLSNTLQAALNTQIKHELYSAYLYLSMSAHFESANLPGFAHWMKAQAQEEVGHAMKFYGYIHEQGGVVALQAVEQPPVTFGSPLSIFQASLDHERKVTAAIRNLYELAAKENDYATQFLLQWFINEQVEEEKAVTQIIETLKMVGEQGPALFMVNAQLGARGK